MIIAGDIGGTKTVLALYDQTRGLYEPVREKTYGSRDYASFVDIVADFLQGETTPLTAGSFGIAGPIDNGEARTTNLPWVIRAVELQQRFGIRRVRLLNDLQAIATAVPHLRAEDLHVLNEGRQVPRAPKAVVAPGTGLGEAYLVWGGSRYYALPTEGGHASFAPGSPEEVGLLGFLADRFGHVSFERVCSGSGIPNIYDYLVDSRRFYEPGWLKEQLADSSDRAPIIAKAALDGSSKLCEATIDLFVRILGGVTGNMALKFLATGGLYLGGGIPPKLLQRLSQPDFLAAVQSKGRFSDLCANVPLYVILNPMSALLGAAFDADALDREGPAASIPPSIG